MSLDMKDVIVIEHPLVQHYLSILRDKTTGITNLKYSLEKISYLFASYIYSTSRLKDIKICTICISTYIYNLLITGVKIYSEHCKGNVK